METAGSGRMIVPIENLRGLVPDSALAKFGDASHVEVVSANDKVMIRKFVGPSGFKSGRTKMSRSEAARLAANARWAGRTTVTGTPRARSSAEIRPAIESWNALKDPDGGFTINTGTGTQPTSGYAVAMRGHSSITPVEEFFAKGPDGVEKGRKVLRDWLRSKADVFSDPSVHVGAWHDPKNGEIVLDAVQVISDRGEAIRTGREGNEQSIADLGAISRGEWDVAFIDTGGSGDREVYT